MHVPLNVKFFRHIGFLDYRENGSSSILQTVGNYVTNRHNSAVETPNTYIALFAHTLTQFYLNSRYLVTLPLNLLLHTECLITQQMETQSDLRQRDSYGLVRPPVTEN